MRASLQGSSCASARHVSSRPARVGPRFVAAAVALLVAGEGAARADVLNPDPEEQADWTRPFEEIAGRDYGVGVATMALRYAHAVDPAALRGASDVGAFGLAARGLYGKRVGYGVGLGLELGASGAPGFAFGFDLFPAGFAVALGPTGFIGAFFGMRFDGISGRVPFTLMMPAELRIELDLGRRVRVGALYALAWAPAEEARRRRPALAPFAAESTLAFTARIGKTFPRFGLTMGRGYFVRLERREQMGTALYGAAIGAEIEGAD